VEDCNWETIFTDIIGLYSTTPTYLASKEIEFGEKREIRAITPFKVIQGHRGRYKSKVCMRHSISDMGGVLRSGLGELRAHVRRAWQLVGVDWRHLSGVHGQIPWWGSGAKPP